MIIREYNTGILMYIISSGTKAVGRETEEERREKRGGGANELLLMFVHYTQRRYFIILTHFKLNERRKRTTVYTIKRRKELKKKTYHCDVTLGSILIIQIFSTNTEHCIKLKDELCVQSFSPCLSSRRYVRGRGGPF